MQGRSGSVPSDRRRWWGQWILRIITLCLLLTQPLRKRKKKLSPMYLITTSLRIPIKSEVDSLKDRFSSSWYICQYAQADNGHVYTAGKERVGKSVRPGRGKSRVSALIAGSIKRQSHLYYWLCDPAQVTWPVSISSSTEWKFLPLYSSRRLRAVMCKKNCQFFRSMKSLTD